MGAGEEKILVSVRVRPLNEKEKTRNDGCDWECIDNTTIICNHHNLHDRPSYTFDKVFGFDCTTKQVYDDGAKEVALCVLSGINSSIFAYGQTSSGKTYTMNGITGFAIDDIFSYIEKHKEEREFTLKFSAIEIYNEAVRDLLSEENTPLRLLDDPERGTVVEKLKEDTLTDRTHLEELLSICETQRKIGETSMNDASSRSHQILRLTIESSGRELSEESSATLAASVCFVDLAGSERASQALSAGSRLKEGCHINRSLLTLGTVIRKLSKGRSGHVSYRDSKLTRILQNSLGGNARTAIICTMSPARSHLEQSRNTLLFASCAKEVTTNAQVNMVVSEKALVKQLQRELARMENELRNLGPSFSSSTSEFYAMLKEKEELIAKMEEQIQELQWQRDVAQSQVENLLKSTAEERSSSSSTDHHRRRRSYDSTDFDEPRMLSNLGKKSNFYSPDEEEEDGFLLEDTTPQFSGNDLHYKWEEMAQRTLQESEDVCKEVRFNELKSQKKSEDSERVQIQDLLNNIVEKKEPLSSKQDYTADEKAENEELSLSPKLFESEDELTKEKLVETKEIEQSVEKEQDPSSKEEDMEKHPLKDESEQWIETAQEFEESDKDDNAYEPLNKKLKEMQKTSEGKFTKQKFEETKETEPPVKKEDIKLSWSEQEQIPSSKKEDLKKNSSRDKPEQHVYEESDKDDNTYEALKKKVKEMQKTIEYFMSMQLVEQKQSPSFMIDDDNTSPRDYLKMKRSRSCRENLLSKIKTSHTSFDLDNTIDTDTSFHEFISGLKEMAVQHQELDTETKKLMQENKDDESTEFERQQSQIIELWEVCNVPLVHRTYFFLLFKGDDLSDSVYIEVELRRLSFLKESSETLKRQNGKALTREKEWLAKKIHKRFGKMQREEVYKKWRVELSSKQRSLQVIHKLWINTKDLEHCKESASLVASLVGFVDSKMTPKEMFGLSFSPTAFNTKSFGWRFTNSLSRISSSGGF